MIQDNGITNYTILNESVVLYNNSAKGPFNYYIDDENVTLFKQPDLMISFYIYDMKSITPSIKYKFRVESDLIKDVIKGDRE